MRHDIPRDPGQVSVGAFVADQVIGLGRGEMGVDGAEQALDLARVPVDGRLHLFWVVQREPGALAKVRPLAGHLQVEPAELLVLFLAAWVAQFAVIVEAFGNVLEDCTRLEDGDFVVGVVESWDAPVGVDTHEAWLLDLVEVKEYLRVGYPKLGQVEGHFPRIRPLWLSV